MIAWGSFLTAAVIFVLTALAVFLLIAKPYNADESRQAVEEEEEAGPAEVELLEQIRDLLAK